MKRVRVFLLPILLFTTFAVSVLAQSRDEPNQSPVRLSEENLGHVLSAIGLRPSKTEKRYDFAFKTSLRGEEWKFSMSAVLSRNEQSIWVMAWLDQIPQTAAKVPRTALLRLLAANDRLGKGKFFAYIPSNKRFVLQRIVANKNMTSHKMRETLQDLAISVADEHLVWATAGWNPGRAQQVADDTDSGRSVPQNPADPSRSGNIRASESASKYDGRPFN